ncbi:MAG TPA: hypothetical protein PLF81_04825 [Candidatus Anammoximicrobium sp.]|nr:hypothetical protein [Candidatus Anammoximicrobium sp.]
MAFIDGFWFSDVSHNVDNPVLVHADYRLDSAQRFEMLGVTLKRGEPFRIQVSSERYTYLPNGRVFVTNSCRGRGYDTFRVAFKESGRLLSVFFHRGDSQGNGGSNFYWLRRPMIKSVFAQLDRHAIVVSDGSNAIPQLAKFHRNPDVRGDAVAQCESFNICGRQLKCIGYLGEKYGPTLVWSADAAEPNAEPQRNPRSGIG